MKAQNGYFVLIVSSLCTAAAAAPNAATQPEKPKQPRVVKLTLSPAPESQPALRHTLLPNHLDQVPGNAVQQMYMAAQTAGELSKGDDSDKLYGQLIDWLDLPLRQRPTDEIRAVLDKARTALHYAKLAAEREYAWWDIPTRTEAFAAMLPYMRPYRMIERLLALRIGLALSETRFDDALADLKTGFALARWTTGPTLIQDLVAASNLTVMTKALEAWIDRADSANLYWALANLPKPLISARDAFEFERFALVSNLPPLATIKTTVFSPTQADDLVRQIVDMKNEYNLEKNDPASPWRSFESAQAYLKEQHSAARQALIAKAYAREKVEAMPPVQAVLLERFITFEFWRDELFKLLSLPYWQSAGKIRVWAKQFDAYVQEEPGRASPFLELIPSIASAHFKLHDADRNVAALQVLEAIRMHMARTQAHLPRSLDEIQVVPLPHDPITGKPFVYQRTETGASLILPTPDPEWPDRETRYELTVRRP
jgi:hypothetical protein